MTDTLIDQVVGGCIGYHWNPSIYRCERRFDGITYYPFLYDQEDYYETDDIGGRAREYAYQAQVEAWRPFIGYLTR